MNQHLQTLEKQLGIDIHARGNQFYLTGNEADVHRAQHNLQEIAEEVLQKGQITLEDMLIIMQSTIHDRLMTDSSSTQGELYASLGKIKPRTPTQADYIKALRQFDINFGVGPAGTGKTYLAVACAVEALKNDEVNRIILVRPAVEAGEKLGFLPGDLAQKVDPYLRPLYDGLNDLLGTETVERYLEKGKIEVAPLAYMRGRTLNDAYIILDESQNTTREQMKMFLTRIGFGSKAVITGDPSQIDLPKSSMSGLVNAMKVLANIKGVAFTYFSADDVVRHPLVQKIVNAYDAEDK